MFLGLHIVHAYMPDVIHYTLKFTKLKQADVNDTTWWKSYKYSSMTLGTSLESFTNDTNVCKEVKERYFSQCPG